MLSTGWQGVRSVGVLAGLVVVACALAYTFEEPDPILNQIGWFCGCLACALLLALFTFLAVGVLL